MLSREPGTYTTPPVPVRVGRKKVPWISYACLAAESTPIGCGLPDRSLSVSATSFRLGHEP